MHIGRGWCGSPEYPIECVEYIVFMVIAARCFGLIAEGRLIDSDIGFVSQLQLDDIIELNARCRPLRGGCWYSKCCNDQGNNNGTKNAQ